MSGMPPVLLVVGPHRSGTSAVTRVLSLLGARLPPALVPPAADDPTGFWEPSDIVGLHESWLAAAGRARDDPRPLPDGAPGPGAADAVRTLVEGWHDGSDVPVVVKDPRLCTFAPVWLDALGPEATVVLSVRDPADVARSLGRRDGSSPDAALWLWLTHTLAAERSTRSARRVVADYDALVTDPPPTARALAAGLGLPAPDGPTLDAIAAIGALLRHRRADRADRPDGATPAIVELAERSHAALLASGGPDSTTLDEVAAEVAADRLVAAGFGSAWDEIASLRSERAGLAAQLAAGERWVVHELALAGRRVRRTDAAVVVVAEPGVHEWRTVLLVDSLRRWGGDVGGAPVYVFSLTDQPLGDVTRDELHQLGAVHVDTLRPRRAGDDALLDRVLAAAHLERTSTHEIVVVAPSDAIVVRPLDDLELAPDAVAATSARPDGLVAVRRAAALLDAVQARWLAAGPGPRSLPDDLAAEVGRIGGRRVDLPTTYEAGFGTADAGHAAVLRSGTTFDAPAPSDRLLDDSALTPTQRAWLAGRLAWRTAAASTTATTAAAGVSTSSSVAPARTRAVAVLAVRNEERFIGGAIDHLVAQGVDVYVIDNESDDATASIVRERAGDRLLGLEHVPFDGTYRWRALLRRKEELFAALDADWVLHLDADERPLPPAGFETLEQALEAAGASGHEHVEFDEFAFIPTLEEPDHDHPRFEETLRTYYYFRPVRQHLVRAHRRRPGRRIEIEWSGGHLPRDLRPELVAPARFPLRHYLFLSRAHAATKYGQRRFDAGELAQGWHGWRSEVRDSIPLPPTRLLQRDTGVGALDRSQPWSRHWVEAATEA